MHSLGCPGINLFCNAVALFDVYRSQLICSLQIHPGLCITAKIARKTQCCICSNGSSLFYDFMQASGRYSQGVGKRINTHIQRDQVFFA